MTVHKSSIETADARYFFIFEQPQNKNITDAEYYAETERHIADIFRCDFFDKNKEQRKSEAGRQYFFA